MYNQTGQRIFYNALNGEIIFVFGESEGDVQPLPEMDVRYVDLEYGEIDIEKEFITSIDVATGKPILVKREVEPSPDEKIQELENQLLLAEDANVGGIL